METVQDIQNVKGSLSSQGRCFTLFLDLLLVISVTWASGVGVVSLIQNQFSAIIKEKMTHGF